MLVRIISALLGIPLLLFVVIEGGIFLKVSILILAILGIDEFFNAFHNINIKPSKPIGIISAILLTLFTYNGAKIELIMFWFFLNIFMILGYILLGRKEEILSSGITAMGIYYIVFFMFHINFLASSYYPKLLWLVFITAFVTDTFAYFTGVFFGKTKLCPNISPKKTVEGSVGGILGCTAISGIFASIVIPELFIHCLIMGFIGSIIAQLGDLTASMFKRYVGIKDYGKIMPGHGGVLDRFDSILFTAPLIYYYTILVIK
ncbi:MAG: phosphatidate cytidylyltransferase [Anaerosolibacter sp.]|jgi:phosphatidate cytidylyltransferase|uniref:phosphatidate cytidylyltransferase n=1 Tax=Anaerosolibacter sp. TaxID=1872527 RepID=UPI00260BC292|nr:phosphatidate cytidylyltransferase [Anaerosolibacter sp.]MDF2545876.1 phosphatidate cytidylyltransferase [Anaerosolibacter sp.]